jgi:hypothetical protein
MQSLNLHKIETSKQIELVAETCLNQLQQTGDVKTDRVSARHISSLPENLLRFDSKLVFY